MGLMRNPDINGESNEGVAINQITTRNGLRDSASTAYLSPALQRANLLVETGANVAKILFKGKRADGVAYTQRGQAHSCRARRDVILAAGSINSPQLLQLSGVGPGAALQRGLASRGISGARR